MFVAALTLGLAACTTSKQPPTAAMLDEARKFITENERSVRPLEIALNRAWWDANITGTDAAFQAKEEAQNRLDAALSDPAQFATLKRIHDALQGGVPKADELTALHELGHSVYSSLNIPPSMPYALRMESHILTTEGIAMMFEKFSKNAGWMERMGLTVPEREALQAAGAKARRRELLIFAAWAQVMFRFERAMYANPDQDLNKLWWDLVERYQRVHRADGRNAPDYAAKIHVVESPAYYHNYLMGELFAAQVHHTIAREVLKTEPAQALYNGRPDVGQVLKDKIFTPGRSLSWNELTRYATGEGLNPKAFAEDLKGQ
jgi:hypothetical protein